MFWLFFGGFLIPIMIIVFIYSLIFCKMRTRYGSFSQIINSENESNFVQSNSQGTIVQRQVRTEIKLAKQIILVVLFFCITWLPYATLVIYAQFGVNIEDYLTPYTSSIPLLLSKLSVISTPIVFTLSDSNLLFGGQNHKHAIRKAILISLATSSNESLGSRRILKHDIRAKYFKNVSTTECILSKRRISLLS